MIFKEAFPFFFIEQLMERRGKFESLGVSKSGVAGGNENWICEEKGIRGKEENSIINRVKRIFLGFSSGKFDLLWIPFFVISTAIFLSANF